MIRHRARNSLSARSNVLPDITSILSPDTVREIHREYLEAGADIIRTNSFNANDISLLSLEVGADARSLSRRAAELAVEAATPYPGTRVAGAVGPVFTPKSMNGAVLESTVREAYGNQMRGLLEGGVDLIIVETVVSLQILRCALDAFRNMEDESGKELVLIVSASLDRRGERLPSRESIGEFCKVCNGVSPFALGFNCCYGSSGMAESLRFLRENTDSRIYFSPNAGIPSEKGAYPEPPEVFAANLSAYLSEGLINIVGGCCGTTPGHIRRLNLIRNNM